MVKLGLELDPVQPEAVEEGRQAFHHAQDADRQERPEGEDGEHDEGAVPGKVLVVTLSAARWPMFSRYNAILKPPKLTYFVTLEAASRCRDQFFLVLQPSDLLQHQVACAL